MTTRRPSVRTTRDQARRVARRGVRVRDRVRTLTVRALRDRDLRRGDISGVVDDVFRGASDGLDGGRGADRRGVLRQVFQGLSDAVGSLASAGADTARGLARRGATIAERDVPEAARRVSAASAELMDATGAFARRASGEVRDELEGLVRRSQRSGTRSRSNERLLEDAGDAARAGFAAARRAAGGLAMAAGGFFEGLAEVAMPRPGRPHADRPRPDRPRPARTSPRSRTRRRAGRAARVTGRGSAGSRGSSRRSAPRRPRSRPRRPR